MAKKKVIKELILPKTTPEVIQFEGLNITIKKYLPAQNKLNLITTVSENCFDKNENTGEEYNSLIKDLLFTLQIAKEYTDLELGDSQLQSYDALMESGLFDKICEVIPEKEIRYLDEKITSMVANKIDQNKMIRNYGMKMLEMTMANPEFLKSGVIEQMQKLQGDKNGDKDSQTA